MLRTTFLLLLLLAGCHGHEHTEAGVVEARAFVITNEHGRPRGLWEYRQDLRSTVFTLLDEEERIRANMMVVAGMPTFNLLDAQGQIRANLTLEEGAPHLTFSAADGEGRLRVGLAPGADGVPQLRFLGGERRPLALGADAQGRLVLRDAEGEVVARLPEGG